METYRLASEDDRWRVIRAIGDLELDKRLIVQVKTKSTKSDRQRALQWLLYNTIAAAGVGSSDVAANVDLDCKWLFRNIWLADDDLALGIYQHVMGSYPDQKKKWVEKYLHTEQLSTKQMSEFLTSIYNYFGQHGVNLPDPSIYGDLL